MHVHKYIVRLTGKEKRELRQLKRRAKTEARLAERARILLWAHDGVTIDETATRLDCGRDKVILRQAQDVPFGGAFSKVARPS